MRPTIPSPGLLIIVSEGYYKAVCRTCCVLWRSGFSTRAHVVRAMLEAICFQTREVLEAMRKDADVAGLKLLRVDGGASRGDLLMQMQVEGLRGRGGGGAYGPSAGGELDG